MGNGLRTQARRVLLQQVAPAYRRAPEPQRQEILEHFVADTSYARKYALWLLNRAEDVLAPPAALRRRYGPEVEEALVLAWETLNRICTKRLIPFLSTVLQTLEEHEHLALNEDHRRLLLSMSAATADRLLQAHRYTHPPQPFDHQSGSLAQTADPDSHICPVGRGHTGLPGRVAPSKASTRGPGFCFASHKRRCSLSR